jgi:methylmalonyl-CoA mutase
MHQFPKITREDWLKRAIPTAKGKSFDADAALQGRIDGPRANRTELAPWKIFQRVDHPTLSNALAQAKDDLANGADGLILTDVNLAAVLDELPLHTFSLRNEAGDEGAKAIIEIVQRQPIDPARLTIDFGIRDAALAKDASALGFSGPFIRGDGRQAHAEGATDGQEIGVALAEAFSRLHDLALKGSISIILTATQSIFDTIAKFRAARIVWQEMLPDTQLALHGETSQLCLAKEDAHSNILRIAASAFAAGLGGADSFSALPHSFNQGIANGFARRVARNAQLLLQHEAQIWRVTDPAAGAGAIEKRTQQLCEEARAIFKAAQRGEQIAFDPTHQHVSPVIGVSVHRQPIAAPADVEAET